MNNRRNIQNESVKNGLVSFCFSTLLFFSISLFSQEQKENVFSLKTGLGLSGTQIHGDNYSGFDKAGIYGGAVVSARMNKRLSLDLGFLFTQKGSRHNQNPVKNDYSYYYVNLNYIEVPLIANYLLNKDYFVSGGPSIAYLASYTEQTERGDWTGVYPFETYEYGINVGLGKRIKEKFIFEVRSSNSISPIRSYGVLASTVFYPNAVAQFFNKGLYNNVLTFILSYQFKFKSRQNEPVQN